MAPSVSGRRSASSRTIADEAEVHACAMSTLSMLQSGVV